MGDLLVIKQELERYADGEVAHIENVLASESKSCLEAALLELWGVAQEFRPRYTLRHARRGRHDARGARHAQGNDGAFIGR
jgi:hypothetical protein